MLWLEIASLSQANCSRLSATVMVLPSTPAGPLVAWSSRPWEFAFQYAAEGDPAELVHPPSPEPLRAFGPPSSARRNQRLLSGSREAAA